MQNGEGPRVDDAVGEIADLLATAYLRYAKAPPALPEPAVLPSTEVLDNTGEKSLHEMRLTGHRGRGKGSAN
jgi:hypothetical protein